MVPDTIKKQVASLVDALSLTENGKLEQKSGGVNAPYLKLNRRDFEEDNGKLDTPFKITCFTYDSTVGELTSHWEIRFDEEGVAVFFGDMDGHSFDEDKMSDLLSLYLRS